jgi:hypothetical protein
MNEYTYDREAAVAYAHDWAFSRNPEYYDFERIGGDCTNFVSQCIYAATGKMNPTPETGWFYYDINDRAPAWTSVIYIYNFLINNKSVGPFGHQVPLNEIAVGDLVQLRMDKSDYQHTPIIVSIGKPLGLDSILVAAHSYDSDYRPLNTYKNVQAMRFIHIDGYRK